MKNSLFTIGLGLFIATQSFAQGGYLRLEGGFGISATNDAFIASPYSSGSVVYDTANQNKVASLGNLYGTSGQGPTVRLSGGYMFNKNFGVELQLYYMFGMYHTIADVVKTDETYQTRERSSQLRAVPALIVDGGFEKVSPYARFGVLLPLAGKTTQFTIAEDALTRTEYQLDAYGSFSVGFESAIGIRYNFNPNLSLRAEFYYAGLRIKSDYAKIVKNSVYDLNGNLIQDLLENAPVYSSQINFVDKLDENSNTFQIPAAVPNFDQEKPLDVLAQRGNYSSFGLNVGVQYVFGKKAQ